MSEHILIAHGGGGELSSKLIEEEIVSRFGDGALQGLPDAASLQLTSNNILFSTDSFVVQPFEFPGGNIGDLAVHGTVNDISVAGGSPSALSLALILEEGLPLVSLRRILDSVKSAADKCGVKIVTGDTKVVSRGQCDGIYINTAGIGEKYANFDLDKKRIVPGDAVLISGPIGDHGMAVLTVREELPVENGPKSDSGSVHNLVKAAYEFAKNVKFMRDPTRGGVATVLNEIAAGSDIGITLKENNIPISSDTRGIAEMLGIDLLNVACEGRMLLICDHSAADNILQAWKLLPEGVNAKIIGFLNDTMPGKVTMQTFTGGSRMISVPRGEILPRIC
jgi:hydrogenase expression/formation protein HypE